MKALTLHQPWATLVALGVKTIETRSWSTKYRGPLAIHAGRATEEMVGVAAGRLCREDDAAICGALVDQGIQTMADLPLGAIVATCTLVDVVPMVHTGEEGAIRTLDIDGDGSLWLVEAEGDDDHPDDRQQVEVSEQRPYGNFTPGRFAWLLEDIKPTTERCPACWGRGFDEGHRYGDLTRGPDYIMCRQHGDVGWGAHGLCPRCKGHERCDPIPARGRQQLWEWTPERVTA